MSLYNQKLSNHTLEVLWLETNEGGIDQLLRGNGDVDAAVRSHGLALANQGLHNQMLDSFTITVVHTSSFTVVVRLTEETA